MVSACVTWKGATKPFFVNENGLKVNAKTYKKHLEKQLFPEVDRLMNGTSLQRPISSLESCSKFLERKIRLEIHPTY